MKYLDVPVPDTLSARYLVPLPVPMTEAEVRWRVIDAIEQRLAGPLRTSVLYWLSHGPVSLGVMPAGWPASMDPYLGDVTSKQLERLADARAFAVISATERASLIARQEWQARGPAAALAASLQAPLLDAQVPGALGAEDALASLPAMAYEGPTDMSIRMSPVPWVSFEVRRCLDGTNWALSRGMRRFGLPELSVGGTTRNLAYELTEILRAVTFRLWTDLVMKAQATPEAEGLLHLPPWLRIPTEMDIHRADLDAARGMPTEGGTSTTIGLDLASFGPGESWLAIRPPASWAKGLEHFVSEVCHALSGFEEPHWDSMPRVGAFVEAMEQVRETRRRFVAGDLPPGGQLLIRHDAGDTGLRWARVESWPRDDQLTVRDVGRELSPGGRPGVPVAVAAQAIVDWAIWVDGEGVTEGARTESSGWPDRRRST
jgi:hypothetical protein